MANMAFQKFLPEPLVFMCGCMAQTTLLVGAGAVWARQSTLAS